MISYKVEGGKAYNPLLMFWAQAPWKWLLRDDRVHRKAAFVNTLVALVSIPLSVLGMLHYQQVATASWVVGAALAMAFWHLGVWWTKARYRVRALDAVPGQYTVSIYTVEWVSYFAALALHLTSVRYVFSVPSQTGGTILLTLASICLAFAFVPLIEASYYQLTRRRA